MTDLLGSPEDGALINNAHGSLVEDCMAALGWVVDIPLMTADVIRADRSQVLTPVEAYLFDDAARAAASGYGLAGRVGSESAAQSTIADFAAAGSLPDVAAMTPGEAERYWLDFAGAEADRVEIVELDGGTSSASGTGCLAEATKRLWGDIANEMTLVDVRDHVQYETWSVVLASRSVSSALRAWRDCISDTGFEDLTDPQAAVLAAEIDPDLEVAVAVAHVACTRAADLANTFGPEFYKVGTGLLGEFEGQLQAYRELHARAVDAAKEVLGLG